MTVRREGIGEPGVGIDSSWTWQEPWLLLVEDDAGDALLVQELVSDGAPGLRLEWVRSLAEAAARLDTDAPDCVLLDLHLPDAHGLEALASIREYTDVAVVVMTGLDEEQTGLAAVASGAQDYLVKGRVEPELFGRAVRYAIQRKQAERTAAALQASQLRAQENARLERGLLPTPLLPADSGVSVIARYRPGRAHALLGGDFYDVVQDGDGTVHAVIGDVSGHGPDAAAAGVALRLAWRTLVLSGVTGARQLRVLEQVLLAERTDRQTFATATTLTLEPRTGSVRVLRAGHPGMVHRRGAELRWIEVPGGPALGFLPDRAEWPVQELSMPADDGLMLFTDGLFEGCVGSDRARLGEQGMLEVARSVQADHAEIFVDELIGRVEDLAGATGGLDDDLAILYLRWSEGREQTL
ncbi:fused response regulator/phosphatase [Nocardia transvalensis]|uniref:PP2C family protein-serine/threonine phosphatase n=1 Tax=Nocardia transvalensis TaxID=37333 RepID=UPI002B4B250A|nr:fused response regulator/phosphatase [Nocardia transvalensis]